MNPKLLMAGIDATLGLGPASPSPRMARKNHIERLCECLDITVAVRPYTNACAVAIWVDIDDERVCVIDNKEPDQDVIAIVARTAGIKLKRTVKIKHEASSEAMDRLRLKLDDHP